MHLSWQFVKDNIIYFPNNFIGWCQNDMIWVETGHVSIDFIDNIMRNHVLWDNYCLSSSTIPYVTEPADKFKLIRITTHVLCEANDIK